MAKKIAACLDWLLGFNGCLMIAVATLQIVSRALGRPVAWTVELLTFLGLFSVVPGVAFEADGFCRLSYATSEERIAEGLNRIEAFIKELE